MKNLIKLFGLIALAAVIGLSMTACDTGGGGDGGGGTPPVQSRVYESKDSDGNTYKLEITEASAGRAAYTPQSGDTYVLTITFKAGGTKKSSGTVAISGNNFILTPSNKPEATITITVTPTDTNVLITGISGEITFEDGATQPEPSEIIPVKEFKTLEFHALKWDNSPTDKGETWQALLALSDFTPHKPRKGDTFTFSISGTADKAIEWFTFQIYCDHHTNESYIYQSLGGCWDPIKLPKTFDITLDVEIGEDPQSDDWYFGLNLENALSANGGHLPANAISFKTVMATVRNFRISLDKVE